jgi:hypothetical protein
VIILLFNLSLLQLVGYVSNVYVNIWAITLNILFIDCCGVNQESVEYPTWGYITFFDS